MKLLPALLLSLFLPLAVHAETKVNLSQFTLGKTISGAEVTQDTVKGKPVLIEFWGVNCGPCLAHMPMFNSLAKRYDSKGLVVIGAHCQQASDEEIMEKVKATKVKFPVTTGTSGPVQVGTIPHSFIFAPDGELLFHGHPDDKDFDKALRQAMKAADAAGVGPAATDKTKEKDKDKEKTTVTGLGGAPLVPDRTWTNAEGKPLAAALLSVTDGQGKFRKKDGSIFSYPVSKLSSSDQEIITEASKPKADTDAKEN